MKPYPILLWFVITIASLQADPITFRVVDSAVWLETDVKAVHPEAVLLKKDAYTQQDSQIIPKSDLPAGTQQIWIEQEGDWMESVTPPNRSEMPSCGLTEIKLIETVGSCEVAWMKEPDKFVTAQDGLVSPKGYRIKTGEGSSVACLLGGVNSCRFAPNSEGEVVQELVNGERKTQIQLKSGAVFSKVGRRSQETQSYRVATVFGTAAAKGTDFVAVAMPDRLDVWIAEGTVELTSPTGQSMGSVSADGKGVKIIRTTPMADPKEYATANSQTMGAAVALLPGLNLKTAGIKHKMAHGETLTPEETAFMKRLKKFTWYIQARKVNTASETETLSLPQKESPVDPSGQAPTTP